MSRIFGLQHITLPISSSSTTPGENHHNIMPISSCSPSTGKNHHEITPPSIPCPTPSSDSPSSDLASPMHYSSRLRVPSSQIQTADGLLPNRYLSNAISEAAASSKRKHSNRLTSHPFPLLNELLTVAFLLEFSPFRESHSLIPLDISDISPYSVDGALSVIADGSLELLCDDDDDPKWAEAMASSEHEYWIAGV
jgi:hypothetical protein